MSTSTIPATAAVSTTMHGAPETPLDDQAAAAMLVDVYRRVTEEMGKFIVGQQDVIEQLMIAILAGGH